MGNVNTIGNKYLGVTDNSIMFLTKGSTNIMTRLESSDENLYKFFSVNDSGKKIMESIDGSATINDFIKNFCENYNLEYETNKGWIAAFIMEMIQKKALKLSEIPMDNSKVLLQGSEDTISPVHATIEITEKCNLKCKHCYLEAGICKTSMIDYDRFEKLVDEMVANHVLNVEITGGEIFMHPRVLDILKLCYKKFAMLGILTNGTIMTDEVLELIAENKDRTVVNISIDAVDPDMHDEFRGMNGSWKASCNTIRRLADKGIKVRMASCISKDNMWEIDKLADLAVSLGASIFSFNFIEEFGRGSEFSKEKGIENAVEYDKYVRKIINDYKDIIPVIKEEDKSEMKLHENCGAGTRSVVIGADGYIRPCPLSPKLRFMGNVLKDDFKSVFDNPKIKRLQEIIPPDIRNGCDPDCKYLANCTGCYIKGIDKCKSNNMKCSWITKNHLEDVLEMFTEDQE